jgi:hypothetical protein
MIKLEIQADNLTYVRTVAKGTIDYIKIINDGFESMTENG